jgi:hypothetical protein
METATCPAGHESTDLEFCEVCGLAMTAAGKQRDVASPLAPERDVASQPCPACGAPLDGRFCESCGHDSLAAPAATPVAPPAEPSPASWTATVSADRAYYNTVMAIGGPDADRVDFPAFCPDRFFPLHGNQITIGRRSASRGINPDIDLTGPPEDPGVSHLHAMLILQPDGTLSVVDVGSSNGTTVNDDQSLLRPNVPRSLSTGDRIHLGAWTTITVRADQ